MKLLKFSKSVLLTRFSSLRENNCPLFLFRIKSNPIPFDFKQQKYFYFSEENSISKNHAYINS